MFGFVGPTYKRDIRKLRSTLSRKFKRCLLPRTQVPHAKVLGFEPVLVVQPRSVEEFSALLKACREQSVHVLPVGLMQHVGHLHRPSRPVVLVSTRGMKGQLDYSTNDHTITVESGMTMRELSALAAEYEHHLPIEVPFDDVTTVGCAVASDAIGLRGHRYGSIRDFVVDCTCVLADGSVVRSCSQTGALMGRNLRDLLVGSHGTLGIVTSVTLQLQPFPEDLRMGMVFLESPYECDYAIEQLNCRGVDPSHVGIANAAAAVEFGYHLPAEHMLLFVTYEGHADRVASQINLLERTFNGKAMPLNSADSLEEFEEIRTWPTQESDFSFEANAGRTKFGELLDFLNITGIAAIAHTQLGLIHGFGSGSLPDSVVDSLRRIGGEDLNIRFTKYPGDDNPSQLPGAEKRQIWLKAVKQRLDPKNVFPLPEAVLHLAAAG